MTRGFSHVTLNVRHLETSLGFYLDVVGCRLVHRGRRDAYLSFGDAWLCLQERDVVWLHASVVPACVDHVALFVEDSEFEEQVKKLREHHVQIVRGPVQRGVGKSVNFLDPDRIQLEFHTSTLAERMKVWE